MKLKRLSTRGALLAAATGCLSALAIAATAWACTVSPQVSVTGSLTSHERKAAVAGEAFQQGVPVEIRWGSSTGPELARANGGNFIVDVEIPEGSTKGVYYLVAIQHSRDGSASFKATTTVEVKNDLPGASSAGLSPIKNQGDLWTAFSADDRAAASVENGSGSGDQSSAPLALGAGLIALGLGALLTAGVVLAGKSRRIGSH